MGFLMQRTFHRLLAILLATIIGCSGLRLNGPLRTSEADWPTLAKTGLRQSAVNEPLTPPLVQIWEEDITGGIGSGSPLIVDTVLVIGNLRGELYAISIETGKRIGWVDIGEAIEGSPVIEGSIVYVAISNSNESLIAFDLTTGKPLWKRVHGDIEASLLLLQGKLYFGNTNGTFLCVSCESGNKVWQFDLPDNKRLKGIRSSAATDGKQIIFGSDDGNVYSLDATDGRKLWQFATGAPIKAAPSISGNVVTIGNTNGRLVCLDLLTGTLRWSVSLQTGIYASAVYAGPDKVGTGGSVIVGTTGGKVVALHTSDGSALWETNVEGVVNSQAAVADNIVFVGTLTKMLFALNTGDGSIIWKQTLTGRVKSAPAIARGRLFVATDDRNVTAFGKAAQ